LKEADEENVLSSKEVQELIKQIITHASKKHPVEFSKRATANFKSKLGNEPTAKANKPKGKPTGTAPEREVASTSGSDPKAFKKAYAKILAAVEKDLPRDKRGDVKNTLADIIQDLYDGRL
jgi:hypothetical protein